MTFIYIFDKIKIYLKYISRGNDMKNCLKCGFEIESDDNFCPKCGHWTSKGYFFLKDNNENIINGKMVEQQNRMAYLFCLMFFLAILIVFICLYRGKEIFSPFIYIKREIANYQFGYNTTILKKCQVFCLAFLLL